MAPSGRPCVGLWGTWEPAAWGAAGGPLSPEGAELAAGTELLCQDCSLDLTDREYHGRFPYSENARPNYLCPSERALLPNALPEGL